MYPTVIAVITGVIFVVVVGFGAIKGIACFLYGTFFEMPGEKEWNEECEKYYTWDKKV